MTRPHRELNPTPPLAYFITFRGYGTWLHGDRRGSVDRFHNIYGTPRMPHNPSWQKYNRGLLKHPPTRLSRERRAAIKAAINETCTNRRWRLWALSVRSNHVHTVVTAQCSAEGVLNAFKASATRKMRDTGCWSYEGTPWAARGSKKKIWTYRELEDAIVYVEHGQGPPLD